MNINHHLSEPLLMAYAAGNLSEAFSLIVASHISLCDHCRAALAAHEAVGGALLEDSADNHSSVDFDATWRLIDAGPKIELSDPSRKRGLFPTALQSYVGGDLADVKWRPVGMGVRQAILPTDRDATVRLLQIPAGCQMPDHGHKGTELTLVLQGAFRDEGDRFGVGDVEIATDADEHTPVAEPGLDCICLAATEAPLRFNGLIHKIAQKFARI